MTPHTSATPQMPPVPGAGTPSTGVGGTDLTPKALARALRMPLPTSEQAAVITHPLTPLLVVAGAGSGKTATMSQRVLYLVATGQVRPDQVLGLTFTRKATAELAQRVETQLAQLASSGIRRLSQADGLPSISTYNSFAARLVVEYGLGIGVDPDSTLITEARAWQIVQSLVEATTVSLPFDSGRQAIAAVLNMDAALSENLLSVEQARQGLEELAVQFEALAAIKGAATAFRGMPAAMAKRLSVLDLVADYRRYKCEHSLMDFGEQIALACQIVDQVPQAVTEMRHQYPAVLLDEFQDTSVAQIHLLSTLFAGSGVTAVGDPNQAIYGWRGASAGALDTFHATFNPQAHEAGSHTETGRDGETECSADTPVLPLSVAWRNDSRILEVANTVSEPLRSHTPKPGDSQVRHIPVKELAARSPQEGVRPGFVAGAVVQDSIQEAQVIASFLEQRRNQAASMAVLCRTRAQFAPVMEALEERDIPYEVIGVGGMLLLPEVADVRSLLTVAADPERGDRLMRLLTGAGIGATDLRALYQLARRQVRLDASEDTEQQSGRDAAGSLEADRAREGHQEGRGAAGRELPGRQTAGMQEHKASRAGTVVPGEDTHPMLAEALEALARAEHTSRPIPVPGLSAAGRAIAVRVGRAVSRVRRAVSLPLPDQVVLAEQALNLDIEVAARVDDPLGRRGLDALRQTAQDFTRDMDNPTLPAFLEWLDMAEDREGGLDAPEIEPEPGAVHILTIHAAKGLEWDCVVVCGLSEAVFPSYKGTAKPDLSVALSGWMTSLEEFPHPLRADAQTLPPFELGDIEPADADKAEVKEMLEQYRLALGRHAVAEERRLAYVAYTRARHDLLLTASYLAKAASRPRPISRFLAELLRRDRLVSPYGPGFQALEDDAVNPLLTRVLEGRWPAQQEPPSESEAPAWVRRAVLRRQARVAGADDVARAQAELRLAGHSHGELAGHVGDSAIVQRWRREAALLLAERESRETAVQDIEVPAHIPATGLDRLRTDPQEYLVSLRRPLPRRPHTAARLGTVFHEAIEQRLAARAALLPLEDAGVPDSLTPSDRELIRTWLKVVEDSPIIQGWQLEGTEVERELVLGDTVLRCRMDAVFRRPRHDSGDGAALKRTKSEWEWLIVDWKTGTTRVDVGQLSVYVHAWARSKGVSTEHVQAAYFYVRHGQADYLTPQRMLSMGEIEETLRVGA